VDGGEHGLAGAAEADEAEQAFAALRAEVAAQHRVLERIAAMLAASDRQEAPDYSPTLGAIARELKSVTARLEALEQMPALAVTPGRQAAELRLELDKAGEELRRGLGHSRVELDGAVRTLRGLIGAVHERREQRQWLCAAGGVGVILGVLLWFMLPLILPWGAGDWVAALPIGGSPWQAGAALMRRANPATWERMVRLYRACPPDSATASCEAAMAARTAQPYPDRRVPSRHVRAN
jgi:ElaB/YqjD/DUF883 family membrane-anchored ribosome-binding protein